MARAAPGGLPAPGTVEHAARGPRGAASGPRNSGRFFRGVRPRAAEQRQGRARQGKAGQRGGSKTGRAASGNPSRPDRSLVATLQEGCPHVWWERPSPKQHAYLLFGFTLARANARMLINAASKRSSAKNAVRTSRSRPH